MRQTIQVDVLTTDEATVAEVQGTAYRETTRGDLLGKGYAKKHPNDEHDVEVGHALAMARALRELAESYETRAWERINSRTIEAPKFAAGGMFSGTIKDLTVKYENASDWNSLMGFKFDSDRR